MLSDCLTSLEDQTFSNFEVLVVDNGSTDDSCNLVRERFPWVRLIRLDHNYGFCGGNNRGIAEASGYYIVLLNNDTKVAPTFLQALFEAAESHPEVGFCASCMLNFYNPSRIDNCGIGLDILKAGGYQLGTGKVFSSLYKTERYVFGASGGAVLYSRDMLDKIGMFDEDFVSHVEDVDLSWRAQLAGYRCLYVPQAIVYHKGAATSKQLGSEVLYRIQRNSTWVYLKNMPFSLMIFWIPLRILYFIYWWFRATKLGCGPLVWKAKVDALRAWKSIQRKRQIIQETREISTLSLLKLMNWRI
jgi:hypothetical protein